MAGTPTSVALLDKHVSVRGDAQSDIARASGTCAELQGDIQIACPRFTTLSLCASWLCLLWRSCTPSTRPGSVAELLATRMVLWPGQYAHVAPAMEYPRRHGFTALAGSCADDQLSAGRPDAEGHCHIVVSMPAFPFCLLEPLAPLTYLLGCQFGNMS